MHQYRLKSHWLYVSPLVFRIMLPVESLSEAVSFLPLYNLDAVLLASRQFFSVADMRRFVIAAGWSDIVRNLLPMQSPLDIEELELLFFDKTICFLVCST